MRFKLMSDGISSLPSLIWSVSFLKPRTGMLMLHSESFINHLLSCAVFMHLSSQVEVTWTKRPKKGNCHSTCLCTFYMKKLNGSIFKCILCWKINNLLTRKELQDGTVKECSVFAMTIHVKKYQPHNTQCLFKAGTYSWINQQTIMVISEF